MENEKKSLDILNGVEHKERSQFLSEDEWYDVTIEDELLDVTKDYPINYSLSINGTPLAPLGGLHAMTGQPGHGKTMTLSMVAAAVLGDRSHGMEWLLSDIIPRPKVLYIDTEMERGNTMLVNCRICAMLGWDFHTPHEQLTILCLREVTTAVERWRKLLKAVWQFQPNVVILDGLIDVVSDFNDNTDCQQLVFKCMAAASFYGISFWTLLHENPGSEKMVGHAGSFLERKASDVMVTRKQKDPTTGEVTFELKDKKVRAKDWAGFKFRVVDDSHSFGLPVLIEEITPPSPTPDLSELEKVDATFRAMNFPANGLSYTDIENGFKAQGITSKREHKRLLDLALENEIVTHPNRRYYFRGLRDDKLEEQSEMPF